jgi:glycosyltransferase involved in cell wall biosynthesis
MEHRPYYLAREWVRQGHHVTIVAASNSHVRTKTVEVSGVAREESIDGVRYVWLRTPAYNGNGTARAINIFSFVAQLYLQKKRIFGSKRPDIVIASSTYPLDIFPASFFARMTGAKLIFEVHDLWPLSPIELGRMSPWHPFVLLNQIGENYACKHSDLVISLLPLAEQHLRKHSLKEGKFAYIPNGIDLEEWDTVGEELPKEHRQTIEQLKTKEKVLVGYAGAHGVANALHTFIDAAKLSDSKKVHFLLVGNGPEKSTLIDLAKAAGVENVSFLPPVPKRAVPKLLRSFDILYIGLQRQPLFRFGISPNKLIDYMMSARPIVCAIEAGNDIVAESGCGISVQAESSTAISMAVRTLLSLSDAERLEMGQNGNEYATEHFDYRHLAQKFIDACADAN